MTDYAFLLKKSVYLPAALSGSCVVRSEKDFPLIFKSAGFNYKEKNSVITLSEIKPFFKPDFKPNRKDFVVNFAFLNKSSVIDCGIKLNDVLATFENLSFSWSVGGSLGCPALDYDGSFGFSVNASLFDKWQYTHGVEEKRSDSEIIAATGSVTTSYKYITTGLDILLYQTESGVFYSLRYTSKNGSITTSSGAVSEFVESDVNEQVKRKRKLWFIPLGWETLDYSYKMILQIKELKNGTKID